MSISGGTKRFTSVVPDGAQLTGSGPARACFPPRPVERGEAIAKARMSVLPEVKVQDGPGRPSSGITYVSLHGKGR